MSITNERTANLIHKEIVFIINQIVRNDQIGYINVTDVDLTKDLSFSNIYYTLLKDDEETVALAAEALEEHKKEIRMELAKKIRNIKKIPNLIFKYDQSLVYGKHIDKLLEDINK
ncbi:Ribosome-binding factor A [Candidatus Phytoplasma pruni]|uniref:Ribosome-binding factor A n=1 Tax=Candidatus Phytoplasma pruni TaxID=479893 RepID=A0A0M1N0W1_9MOLU|nr:30S ribosome-binding factor RbfA [Candidatus Phytoplasma pruni]KOR75675.1 Ribosome-binding factor A [Candidatus Phytoplasma pruni]